MLTPQEISGKELVKAVFGGYDMAVVDDFLETVTADYTALYKENAILKSKIKVLVEKVEEYRSTEDAMRMALLNAQRTGNDMLKSAQEKSDEMIKSATEESVQKYNELTAAIELEEQRLAAAKQATAAFASENRALIAKLDAFLQAVPNLERKPQAEEAPAPEQIQEEAIMDTVHEIDTAMSKIAEDEIPSSAPVIKPATPKVHVQAAPVQAQPVEKVQEAFQEAAQEDLFEQVEEPTVKFDDPDNSHPAFDFENLQFGMNFNAEN